MTERSNAKPLSGRIRTRRNRGASVPAASQTPTSNQSKSEASQSADSAHNPSIQDRQASSNDYEVGFGKPPRQTRFQPGQSGNPRGRPKRSKNTKTYLNDALRQRINVRLGGVQRKMPKNQAMIERLVELALGGNMRAVQLVLDLNEQNEAAADHSSTTHNPATASQDRKLLDEFEAQIRAAERNRKGDEPRKPDK